MTVFNGQINISRDLRQNKQTVFGNRDLIDIIFLAVAIGVAVLFAYLLGFYFKVIDEFLAVILALIPLVLILALGFRRKAGLRYFNYLLMTLYDKKTKLRCNKENIRNVILINKLSDKDSKGINNKSNLNSDAINVVKTKESNTIENKSSENKRSKSKVIKSIINLILQNIGNRKKIKINNQEYNTNNDKVEEQDKIKRKKTSNYKVVDDKTIFVLSTPDIKDRALKYIENDYVSKIQLRVSKEHSLLLLQYNYSYNDFLKNYIKNELKDIAKDKKGFKRIKEKIAYILSSKKRYFTKYIKFLNLLNYKIEFMEEEAKRILDEFSCDKMEFISIDDSYFKELKILSKKVYMIHLYRNDIYEDLVKELTEVSEVVVNAIKVENNIYISTFIVFDDGNANAEKIENICNRYKVIINKLVSEQGIAKSQVSYNMVNPFNNFRLYKGIEAM